MKTAPTPEDIRENSLVVPFLSRLPLFKQIAANHFVRAMHR